MAEIEIKPARAVGTMTTSAKLIPGLGGSASRGRAGID